MSSVPDLSSGALAGDPVRDDARRLTRAVISLSLASFGSGAAMRLNDAMLPRLANEFAVDVGAAALVTSVFAIAYGVPYAQLGSQAQ